MRRNCTRCVSAQFIELAGFFVAISVAYPVTAQVTVNVPGTSNPYLSGMPNGSMCCSGDSAPAQSPVQIVGGVIDVDACVPEPRAARRRLSIHPSTLRRSVAQQRRGLLTRLCAGSR